MHEDSKVLEITKLIAVFQSVCLQDGIGSSNIYYFGATVPHRNCSVTNAHKEYTVIGHNNQITLQFLHAGTSSM